MIDSTQIWIMQKRWILNIVIGIFSKKEIPLDEIGD